MIQPWTDPDAPFKNARLLVASDVNASPQPIKVAERYMGISDSHHGDKLAAFQAAAAVWAALHRVTSFHDLETLNGYSNRVFDNAAPSKVYEYTRLRFLLGAPREAFTNPDYRIAAQRLLSHSQNDPDVLGSAAVCYNVDDFPGKAIALERESVNLMPSPYGYRILGLLYITVYTDSSKVQDAETALGYWEKFLALWPRTGDIRDDALSEVQYLNTQIARFPKSRTHK